MRNELITERLYYEDEEELEKIKKDLTPPT